MLHNITQPGPQSDPRLFINLYVLWLAVFVPVALAMAMRPRRCDVRMRFRVHTSLASLQADEVVFYFFVVMLHSVHPGVQARPCLGETDLYGPFLITHILTLLTVFASTPAALIPAICFTRAFHV